MALIGGMALEINIANPGWLQTYERVAGDNLAPRVVVALATRQENQWPR